MNLIPITTQKTLPKLNDIFVFKLSVFPEKYFFGCVVSTTAKIGGFSNTTLIYLFNQFSNSKDNIPALSTKKLLVAPIATNNLPWSRGYFEIVDKTESVSIEKLPTHLFRDFRGKLFDEQGVLRDESEAAPTTVIGEFGLDSYKTIDDKISDALSIARSQG